MNRLTQASKGTTTAQFWYDGLNRQIARNITGPGIHYTVWDGSNVYAEYPWNSDSPDERLVYGTGGDLVQSPLNARYYYGDAFGSTTHVAGVNANLLESYTYDLYGTPKFYDPDGVERTTGTAYNITRLYTGQPWHSQISLYDNRARFYMPSLGRFLQPDPIGFAGDPANLYRYCANNPANASDPMGTTVTLDRNVDVEAYNKAIDYLLNSQRFAEIYSALRASDATYTVHQIDDRQSGSYDAFVSAGPGGGGDIFWGPYSAHPTGEGGQQSAALQLAHEFDHGGFYDIFPELSELLHLLASADFGDLEEMRVILGDEMIIAIELGEPTRSDHEDYGIVWVGDPTAGVTPNIPMSRPLFGNRLTWAASRLGLSSGQASYDGFQGFDGFGGGGGLGPPGGLEKAVWDNMHKKKSKRG